MTPMDPTNCPPDFSPVPLVKLSRKDVVSETGLSKSQVDALAKLGEIPGTEGRGTSRYSRRFPILRTQRYEKWLAGVLHRRRRLAARKAAQEQAKRNGRHITHGASIARYSDKLCCTLIRMKRRGNFERQANAEVMRIFSILTEVEKERRELGRLLQARGVSEEWIKKQLQ